MPLLKIPIQLLWILPLNLCFSYDSSWLYYAVCYFGRYIPELTEYSHCIQSCGITASIYSIIPNKWNKLLILLILLTRCLPSFSSVNVFISLSSIYCSGHHWHLSIWSLVLSRSGKFSCVIYLWYFSSLCFFLLSLLGPFTSQILGLLNWSSNVFLILCLLFLISFC